MSLLTCECFPFHVATQESSGVQQRIYRPNWLTFLLFAFSLLVDLPNGALRRTFSERRRDLAGLISWIQARDPVRCVLKQTLNCVQRQLHAQANQTVNEFNRRAALRTKRSRAICIFSCSPARNDKRGSSGSQAYTFMTVFCNLNLIRLSPKPETLQ